MMVQSQSQRRSWPTLLCIIVQILTSSSLITSNCRNNTPVTVVRESFTNSSRLQKYQGHLHIYKSFPESPRQSLLLLRLPLSGLKVPFKQLLENSLSSRFNDIAMARHDGIKVKRVDPRRASVKGRSVARAQGIPQQALLADGIALSVGKGRKPAFLASCC